MNDLKAKRKSLKFEERPRKYGSESCHYLGEQLSGQEKQQVHGGEAEVAVVCLRRGHEASLPGQSKGGGQW